MTYYKILQRFNFGGKKYVPGMLPQKFSDKTGNILENKGLAEPTCANPPQAAATLSSALQAVQASPEQTLSGCGCGAKRKKLKLKKESS